MKRQFARFSLFGSLAAVTLSAAGIVAVANQGCSSGDGASAENVGGDNVSPEAGTQDFAGAPVIEKILPLVAVSGGYIYVVGQNLAKADGTPDDVTITVTGADASGASVSIPLSIFKAITTRLVASVPADMDTKIKGKAHINVKTPLGEVQYPAPVFVVKDTGFGGAAKPGYGMLGEVYALQPNTSSLPQFDNPCSDPRVLPNDGGAEQTPDGGVFTCPHTNILVPNFDVPVRSFTAGFPGLGDSLVEWFAIHFTGFLKIDVAGSYMFQSCSDDGSNVYLETAPGALTKIVSNDGTHGMQCAQSTAVELSPGVFPLVVDYFQGPRTEIGLQLKWQAPAGATDGGGTGFQVVPADNFKLFKEEL